MGAWGTEHCYYIAMPDIIITLRWHGNGYETHSVVVCCVWLTRLPVWFTRLPVCFTRLPVCFTRLAANGAIKISNHLLNVLPLQNSAFETLVCTLRYHQNRALLTLFGTSVWFAAFGAFETFASFEILLACLKAELAPPLRPADLYKSPFQHGLLLPSPPASLWPPAAERRLEAAVLIQDSSLAAPLWW